MFLKFPPPSFLLFLPPLFFPAPLLFLPPSLIAFEKSSHYIAQTVLELIIICLSLLRTETIDICHLIQQFLSIKSLREGGRRLDECHQPGRQGTVTCNSIHTSEIHWELFKGSSE